MRHLLIAAFVVIFPSGHVAAQAVATVGDAAQVPATVEESSNSLKVYFTTGSSRIDLDQSETLDRAARTFRDGNPFVMIVSGLADTVGSPDDNLALSVKRASSVARALAERGIPFERLQILGRGNSDLDVRTDDDIAEAGNRVVEISWR